MPLIKRRPNIRLFSPSVVRAGEPFDVRVELDCPAPVPADAVDVVFESHGSYPDALGAHTPLMRAQARVWPGGTLPRGVTRLRARFVLPKQTPGTYRGAMLRISHGVRVHVDIPWWPDARQSFVQPVVAATDTQRPPRPQLWVSKLEGPHDARPYLEASLASGVARPRGALRGSVAFAHTDRFEYRGLAFTLIAREGVRRADGGLVAAFDRAVRSWRMPLREVHEQRPVDFLLRLPEHSLAPGFEFAHTFVRWYLDVAADVPWTRDPSLRIPLTVVPEPHDPQSPPPQPVPVGTERLALVWKNVARLAGLRWDDERLAGAAGRVEIDVRRERIGSASKIQLVVRLRPGVDLGLRVASRPRRGAIRIRARDPRHTDILDAELGPALHAHPRARLVDLEGQTLRLEAATAGVRQDDVQAVAVAAVAVAEALDRGLDRMEAPADLDDAALRAWREAARRAGGRLCVPAVRIDARLPPRLEQLGGGAPASSSQLSTVPGLVIRRRHGADDRVFAVEVEAITPVGLDRRHHLRWSRDDPRPEAQGRGSRPARPWLRGLEIVWAEASTFEVTTRGLRATCPPQIAPGRAVDLGQTLVRALEGILGLADPYR